MRQEQNPPNTTRNGVHSSEKTPASPVLLNKYHNKLRLLRKAEGKEAEHLEQAAEGSQSRSGGVSTHSMAKCSSGTSFTLWRGRLAVSLQPHMVSPPIPGNTDSSASFPVHAGVGGVYCSSTHARLTEPSSRGGLPYSKGLPPSSTEALPHPHPLVPPPPPPRPWLVPQAYITRRLTF